MGGIHFLKSSEYLGWTDRCQRDKINDSGVLRALLSRLKLIPLGCRLLKAAIPRLADRWRLGMS